MTEHKRVNLTLDLCDLLWRQGWVAFRTDRASSEQRYNCDIVAMKGGKVRLVTMEILKSGNSKTDVSSKIQNLSEAIDIGKPISPPSGCDFSWILAVYLEHSDRWYGVNEKRTTVKAGDGMEPLSMVL